MPTEWREVAPSGEQRGRRTAARGPGGASAPVAASPMDPGGTGTREGAERRVHRRVPPHGGREGTDRRSRPFPCAVPRGRRCRTLARRLRCHPPTRGVGQGHGPARFASDQRPECAADRSRAVVASVPPRHGQAGAVRRPADGPGMGGPHRRGRHRRAPATTSSSGSRPGGPSTSPPRSPPTRSASSSRGSGSRRIERCRRRRPPGSPLPGPGATPHRRRRGRHASPGSGRIRPTTGRPWKKGTCP